MMRTRLVNGRVLVGDRFEEGVVVEIDGGLITAVGRPASASADDEVDLGGAVLAPGFLDTQVNGGGGALFNADPSVDCIATIGAAHRRFGTTGFLPTLISDDLEIVDRGIDAVEAAIAQGVPGVLGIHIEGPFLSPRRHGIHDASKFRILDPGVVKRLTRLRGGRTLITLAPERTTPEIIGGLVEAGAIVSAGHTDADYATMRQAFGAGVTGVTHLFNAMSPMLNRAPGVVGAALEDLLAWCGLIVDGHHVSPPVLKLALRCRPLERFMLVTDAMSSVGVDTDHFYLQGRRISVENGICRDEHGVLAGSGLDMSQAVRNAIGLLDLSLEQALAMASRSPAAFLGQADRRGRIAPGYRADLVTLAADLTVRQTWINGALAPERHGEPAEA